MKLKEQKIVVTGGGGFLGRHVMRALKARGVLEENITAPRQEECDLREAQNCNALMEGADLVLHLAGVTGDTEFHKKEPGRIYFDNLLMNTQVMEAARLAGVKRVIAIGSATEYSEKAPLPSREEDLWVGFPEEKHAPYAIAKKLLLIQAKAYYAQYKFLGAHLVMTNIYGPGENLESNVFVPSLIKRVFDAKKNSAPYLEMHGNGDATRDFLYVKDAAAAILLAAEKATSSAPINIASGQEISVRAMATVAKDIIGYKGEIRFAGTPGGVSRRLLDVTRSKTILEFEARTDFVTGLRETIEDFARRL